MINRLLQKYRKLNLQQRVILAINITLISALGLISIVATLNRKNTQYKDAEYTLFRELDYLQTILRITSDKDLANIKPVFYEKTFYVNGYASLIKRDGRVLIDKSIEEQNINSATYFRQMNEMKKGHLTYTDPNENIRSRRKKHIYFAYFEQLQSFITATVYHKDLITDPVRNTQKILLFALIFTLILFTTVNYYVIGLNITKPIKALVKVVRELAKGRLPEKYHYESKNEVGDIVQSFNELVEGIRRTAEFASEIGKNNFKHDFKPLSDEDVLGNSLIEMKVSLQKAAEEEALRKIEDEKRNWTTQGLAKFADILRQNTNDIEELTYNIVSNIIEYMNINQGGIFILNDDDETNQYLELTACFAYDRRKFLEKRVKIGEGLIGTCYLEGQTIYLVDIPQNYIKITSGLGDENPSSLLIVPLKINDKIFGVIELASFNKLEDYKIEFVEKIGESIASTIANVKINNNTALLLEKSQQQAEEMRAQEEEMRQNMEELSATQEAMAEKDRENQLRISELNQEISRLKEMMSDHETSLSNKQENFDFTEDPEESYSPEESVSIDQGEVEDVDEVDDIKQEDELEIDDSLIITEEEISEEESSSEDIIASDDNSVDPDDLLKGNSETQKEWEKHLGKSGKIFKKGKKK
ncbi:MAG: GAF domain-containing protein [Bacteroidetes bacterium]|nr:GAF domain-containing protein [Bacteroidota bacterium]